MFSVYIIKMLQISSEIIIILYATVFTTNVMVLPQLLLEKICLHNDDFNNSMCHDQSSHELQKNGSEWWFFIILSNHLPSLLTIFIWGPITHVIGRRNSVFFIAVINLTQALVYLVNAYFIDAHPGFLLIGSILSSLYGEFQGVLLFCYACIADDTRENLKSRTMRMAVIESCPVLSGLLTGIVAGQILQHAGFVFVYVYVIILDIIMFTFALVFIPGKFKGKSNCPSNEEHELISNEENMTVGEENISLNNVEDSKPVVSINPFHYIKDSIYILVNPKYHHFSILLFLALGCTVSGLMGEATVQVLYLKTQPFVYSAKEIGYYVAFQSIIRCFGPVLLTQISYHCFHMNDYVIMCIGQVSQFLCYIVLGLSRSTLHIYLSNVAGCFMYVSLAAIRSHITKIATDVNYGSLLACLEAFDLVFDLFSGALTLWIYNLLSKYYFGIVFFFLSGFSLLSFLCVQASRCRIGKE